MTKKELKYVNSLKEENERVKNLLLRFMDALGKLKNLDDVVNMSLIPLMTEENQKIRAEIKTEAYKECIEKVMSKSIYNPMGMFYIVPEEWLKDLVGEDK